jgi:hypothetical protein
MLSVANALFPIKKLNSNVHVSAKIDDFFMIPESNLIASREELINIIV